MKLAAILIALGLMTAALIAWLEPARPAPELIAGLVDDGLRAAPCPARTLIEQKSQIGRSLAPPSGFSRRLSEIFPLGSPANKLESRLAREGFSGQSP